MSRLVTCPNGHHWDPAVELPAARGQPLRCPVCGAPLPSEAGEMPSTTGAGLSLPQPPGSVPTAVAQIAACLLAQGRAPEAPPPTIAGYEILELLGSGGMGMVYKARHVRLDRLVALKVLSPALLRRPETVRRFHQEARAAARLAHPHIVTLYDANEVGGTHYLSMEFVAGTDLATLLQRQRSLPIALACDYLRQTALGLEHVHERGLVHRDLKPSNLIVSTEGVVKILDLGLARLNPVTHSPPADNPLTPAGVMGTPDYLAPEQAQDAHTVDIRADIYSLGCTLYHLLTGQVPFPAGSLTQKLLRHQQEEPQPAELLRPDLPAGLGPVLRRLMAKRLPDRYQTPTEVVAALAPFCQASSRVPERRPLVVLSRRWRMAATGVALLMLAVLGVWMAWPPPTSLDVPLEPKLTHQGAASVAGPTVPPSEVPLQPQFTNATGMRLTLIRPGTFWMGMTDAEFEKLGFDRERPRHQVTLTRPFYCGIYEVTQQEYEAVTGSNPSYFKGNKGGPKHPVETVSWHEAVAFCEKLSGLAEEKRAGRKYRLPTEAEWEYACRAGTTTPFHFGPSLSGHQANFDGRKSYPEGERGPYLDRTSPVGSYAPNAFGLYDMHGNVWEWCADAYKDDYYTQSPVVDPGGPPYQGFRVKRGGAWENPGYACRAAKREARSPTDRHRSVGFRVVCVLIPE